MGVSGGSRFGRAASSRLLPQIGLHLGLGMVIVAAFAPWSTIGGRTRDGFGTANTLLTLTHDGLPPQVGWFASTWYLGAFAALAGWALAAAVERRWAAWFAAALFAVAALVMVGFTWAAGEHGRIATRWVGPLLAVVALMIMATGSIASENARRDRKGAHVVRHASG